VQDRAGVVAALFTREEERGVGDVNRLAIFFIGTRSISGVMLAMSEICASSES